jgi:hypothetical protein
MSSTEEMRRVITHCADQLRAALDAETARPTTRPAILRTVVALAYGEGVLRLLTSYLVVTDTPTPDRPAVDGDSPRDGAP